MVHFLIKYIILFYKIQFNKTQHKLRTVYKLKKVHSIY